MKLFLHKLTFTYVKIISKGGTDRWKEISEIFPAVCRPCRFFFNSNGDPKASRDTKYVSGNLLDMREEA